MHGIVSQEQLVVHGRKELEPVGRKAFASFEVRDAFSKERAYQAGMTRGDRPGGRIELNDRRSSSRKSYNEYFH
jgi:hypothetical protein